MNINAGLLALALLPKSQWAATLASATHWASDQDSSLQLQQTQVKTVFSAEKTLFSV